MELQLLCLKISAILDIYFKNPTDVPLQKNLSSLTRAKLEEKQRMIEAELLKRMLKEEWPGREELAAAR